MSIVALKKNSRRFIEPISGGSNTFSLNGVHRNIHSVGPTNLGSYTNKYGATCCNTNTPTEPYKSVMNTSGMLAMRYRANTYPNYLVTPISADHFSQGEYIRNKIVKNSSLVVDISDAGDKSCCFNSDGNGNNNLLNKVRQATYAKDLKVAISHDEYMKGKLMKKNCLPPCKAEHKHFPMYINNSCGSKNITHEEAKTNGMLKDDCCY